MWLIRIIEKHLGGVLVDAYPDDLIRRGQWCGAKTDEKTNRKE
jgi:hypothetical protein